MSSPQDPRELTAEEEREVSALLADLAAQPATTPPEVAARLDDVLAGLVAERTVVPLAERRQRRQSRLPRVLLAAAAVVAGGYAVGNLALDGSLGESTAGDAGSDAGSDAGGGSGAQAERDRPEAADGSASGGGEALSIVPIVRRDHLAADVRRVVGLFGERPAAGTTGGDDDGDGVVDETRDCPVPRLTEDQQLYEVRYQGRSAGLVVGPEEADRVGVTLYSCRDGGVLVTRSVPAP